MKRCELCGTPVKVVGDVTRHYEPVAQPLIPLDEEKLSKLLETSILKDSIFFEDIIKLICKKFGTKRELKREIKFPEKMTYDSDMTGWYIKYCEGWNGAINACRKAYEDSLKEKE